MTTRSKNYFPLGFPIRLSTDSEAVEAAAEEAWNEWRPLFDVEPVSVSVGVHAGSAAETPEAAFVGTVDGFLFSAGEANNARGSWHDRTITLSVSEGTVLDRPYFRYYFLEAAVNQMISGLHFAPIHAACVTTPSGGGILLCGDSGAGKSSLAYACARNGWTYTTDDASFLVRDGGARVVGDAHLMRMRPESVSLFPELAQQSATRRGNGDVRLQIRTNTLPVVASPAATIARAVFLRREGAGGAKLETWNRTEAEEWFRRVYFHWSPAIGRDQARAVSALLDQASLEQLTYSRLEDAVRALEA